MSAPLVSVVIPTYNYGHFVTEAVDSVLAQTYRAFEVIVVDDGSTDDTRKRLAPYQDLIRYVYQENRGLSAARNTGIRAARGRLVALLDSDDLWHPRKLECQVRYFQVHPDAGLVATGTAAEVQDGWPTITDPALLRAQSVPVTDLAVRSRFGPSGVIIRKDCFDAVGLFDETLRSVEDRDMWIRVAALYPVVRLEAPLWWYRPHSGSMSRSAARMEENELKVLAKSFSSIPSLRKRRLLRLKAYSYAAYSAAARYRASGCRFLALRRILGSFIMWPGWYHRDEVRQSFARPAFLGYLLMQMLGLARAEPCA